MRKLPIILLIVAGLFIVGCKEKSQPDLYTVGILQINDAPTLNLVRQGFLKGLEDDGYIEGTNIRFLVDIGNGEISDSQRIAQEFVDFPVDMIVPFSTPSLQAALHAARDVPIIFSSVANPYLAGAGASAEDHLSHISGVISEGPIQQSLAFIKRVLPSARRIGTLWTPSELNSNYYLELARRYAAEMGLEIVAVPISNSSEVLLSAQVLLNKKIDAIYQISDNTINNSFEALGQVAAENSKPLFGGFLFSTELGACAAMGWDFFEMGQKAAKIAARVIRGEDPKNIPFQYMDHVRLHLNIESAKNQGIEFLPDILEQADKIIDLSESGRKGDSNSQ